MILTIRTDKPEAEIRLWQNQQLLAEKVWYAHRELSATLLSSINDLLAHQRKTLTDIRGIIVFQGPGSFTGLRIGLTVANALAHSLNVPLTATQGANWQADGIMALKKKSASKKIALPFYGGEANITRPLK